MNRVWMFAMVGMGLLAGAVAEAGNVMVSDFESGTEGWENEGAATPATAEQCTTRARHGKSCVMFKVKFTKYAPVVQFRVRNDTFPMDVTKIEGFRGFSAWIYLPNGRDHWEAKLFTRSGETWMWGEGPLSKKLEPGWHRLEVPLKQIREPQVVQDVGIQVMNFVDEIESTICIDQVEAVVGPVGAPAPKKH